MLYEKKRLVNLEVLMYNLVSEILRKYSGNTDSEEIRKRGH